MNSTSNSNLSNNIFDFNEVITTFDYNDSSVSFTATVGAIYQVVNYGYQGTQSQDVSITSGATLIKKLTCASNNGCCVVWLKATSTTVNITISTKSNNVGCVLKCSKTSINGIENLSTLVFLGRNLTTVSIPASTSGYSMFLIAGYQGAQYHGWMPSSFTDTVVLGITSSVGKGSGVEQWNLKTNKAYNLVGNNTSGLYWYAY